MSGIVNGMLIKDGRELCSVAEYCWKLQDQYSDNALEYVLQDCRNAIEAMPYGKNANFYRAEVALILVEIESRKIISMFT